MQSTITLDKLIFEKLVKLFLLYTDINYTEDCLIIVFIFHSVVGLIVVPIELWFILETTFSLFLKTSFNIRLPLRSHLFTDFQKIHL